MKISEKFLTYFGAEEDERSISEKSEEELDSFELVEMEIEAVVQELASEHANTETYTTMVQNLKTLTEAHENQAKAMAEVEKARHEHMDAKAKGGVDWGFVAPRVAGVLVYGAATMLFIAIEREHPPAMRIVQAANTLLSPKI